MEETKLVAMDGMFPWEALNLRLRVVDVGLSGTLIVVIGMFVILDIRRVVRAGDEEGDEVVRLCKVVAEGWTINR